MKGKSLKLLVNIIVVIAVFAVSFYIGNLLAVSNSEQSSGNPEQVDGEKPSEELPIDRLNVLLLGVDARPGEEDTRTDTIILASFDKETGKIAMLSIPRDTLVDIPGHGRDKINAANAIGGTEKVVEVVEDMIGIEIPYYVKTNFDGFTDIIDTVGGVTIDVEKNMYYRDRTDVISLKKGLQRLDGEKALQYVRYRHDALGDISRTARQQKFLSALAEEVLQAKTIVKLPKLLPQIFKMVDTNFGVKDVFLLSKLASSFKAENIVAQTLPGTFYDYKGISYWKANEEKTRLVLQDMFKGETTAAVIDPPIVVPKEEPKEKPKEELDDSTKSQEGSEKQGQESTENGSSDNSEEDIIVVPPVQNPETDGQIDSDINQGESQQNPNESVDSGDNANQTEGETGSTDTTTDVAPTSGKNTVEDKVYR